MRRIPLAKIILWFWLPVILWMGVIFILSSISGEDVPRLNILNLPYFHRIGHFIEYSILAALLIRAFLHSYLDLSTFNLQILSFTGSVLFAVSDEWHQTFVSGRGGRLSDVLYDMICLIAGLFLYNCVTKLLLKVYNMQK